MAGKKQQAQPADVASAAADIVSKLLDVAKRDRTPRELSVGIRNVSSETIWIPPGFDQPEVVLHPTLPNQDDPNAVAVVNWARWQQIRRTKLVSMGMVVRDDSILGEIDHKAPEDKPSDIPTEAGINIVRDPHAWIMTRSEAELREDIEKMTSVSSLRRLWAAVDELIGQLEKDVPIEERRSNMSPGIKKAINSLPMKYRLTEELVQERIFVLVPLNREIPDKIRI